jgi:hypothetical protein
MTEIPTPKIPASAERKNQNAKREKLLTFASGGWVILLAVLLSLGVAVYILWPAILNGFQPAVGDRVNVDSYGFDLSNLKIPKEKIIAAGVSKDAVRAIVPGEAELLTPAEVEAYLAKKHSKIVVESDRVIGVIVNGEARAYPLRILVQHEICNDEIAGLPIAVTYSPLCDSSAVFDRRAAGSIREFHNSGLLTNSAAIYYDKQKDVKTESLWGQLQMQAIAGPNAGTPMKRLDFALTTWGNWKRSHPSTRVLAGVARLRENKIYSKEPYSTYFETGTPRFAVDPLWNDAAVPAMTRIVATQSADGKWKVTAPPREDPAAPAEPGNAIYSFVFAFYAAYPDADYSAIKSK